MEEKFEIELKQIVQFNSIYDIIDQFCEWLIDPKSGLPSKLTSQNINVHFSNFINNFVYWTPYDGMKFTYYQAQVADIPDFLNQCNTVLNRLKKENLQVKKDRVERLKNELEKAQSELKTLE